MQHTIVFPVSGLVSVYLTIYFQKHRYFAITFLDIDSLQIVQPISVHVVGHVFILALGGAIFLETQALTCKTKPQVRGFYPSGDAFSRRWINFEYVLCLSD